MLYRPVQPTRRFSHVLIHTQAAAFAICRSSWIMYDVADGYVVAATGNGRKRAKNVQFQALPVECSGGICIRSMPFFRDRRAQETTRTRNYGSWVRGAE